MIAFKVSSLSLASLNQNSAALPEVTNENSKSNSCKSANIEMRKNQLK